jgi:hypothetical protein
MKERMKGRRDDKRENKMWSHRRRLEVIMRAREETIVPSDSTCKSNSQGLVIETSSNPRTAIAHRSDRPVYSFLTPKTSLGM